MTDKVQKIRAFLVGIADADGVSTILAKAIEKKILPYIDSLQEEPVAPKVLEDMLNAKTAAESLGISQEEHDRIVDELIYGKEPELVDVDDMPNKEEEPVSEDLLKASMEFAKHFGEWHYAMPCFEAGAKWQKTHNWKPADGNDLPFINREVIALLDNGKVVFAHRPPEYWDGKDIVTGKVTRNYPKTYDKGGWNIPDVKFWLDVKLPKEIEL